MAKLGFIVIFICVTISAWAHSDHLGELGARVEECRGHFCIRFYSNQEIASSRRGFRHYLVEVGLDGAVLRKKHEEVREPTVGRSLEKVVNGVRTGDRKQIFAVKPGQHAPGAKLFLYRLEKKKVVERIPLPLG